jgi:glycosyltransferase involved in cell wall biosynthesis
MACGCICIGTDVEGINEVIEDGISGLLAKGTEVESIAEVLKRAMRLNEEESKKMAQEARRKIEEEFSLESCVLREKDIFCR